MNNYINYLYVTIKKTLTDKSRNLKPKSRKRWKVERRKIQQVQMVRNSRIMLNNMSVINNNMDIEVIV